MSGAGKQRRITKYDLEDLEGILRKLDRLDGPGLIQNRAFRMIKAWMSKKGYWRQRPRQVKSKWPVSGVNAEG